MSYAPLLAQVDIFSELSESQLDKIATLCEEISMRKGEVVFEENSPSKEVYVIVEGKVEIQIDPDLITAAEDDYEPQTIAKLQRAQAFGEIALVDEGVRSASAKATAPSTKLLKIDRNALMALMNEDKEIGFIVMQNLAADLCFKIRTTNLMVREALLS